MKNIITVTFLVFFSTIMLAQTAKDKIQLGGNLGIATTSNRDFFEINISMRPSSAKFLTDHFAIRGQLALATVMNSINIQNDEIQWGIGGGVGAAYYFGEQRLQPFVAGNIYYGYSRNSFIGTSRQLNFSVEPGLSLFLNDNLAIEFSLPLIYYTNFIREDGQDEFTINNQLSGSTAIGFQYYLR